MRNGSLHSFASFHEVALEYMNFSEESCQSMVNVLVDVDGEEGFGNVLHWKFTEILRQGFVLSWTANNCSSCEKSGVDCSLVSFRPLCKIIAERERKSCCFLSMFRFRLYPMFRLKFRLHQTSIIKILNMMMLWLCFIQLKSCLQST